MTGVSIVGVGMHPFGRHDPNLTGMAMGVEAIRLALAGRRRGVGRHRLRGGRQQRFRQAGHHGQRSSASPASRSSTSATDARPVASPSLPQPTRSGPGKRISRWWSDSTSTRGAPSPRSRLTTATRTGTRETGLMITTQFFSTEGPPLPAHPRAQGPRARSGGSQSLPLRRTQPDGLAAHGAHRGGDPVRPGHQPAADAVHAVLPAEGAAARSCSREAIGQRTCAIVR